MRLKFKDMMVNADKYRKCNLRVIEMDLGVCVKQIGLFLLIFSTVAIGTQFPSFAEAKISSEESLKILSNYNKYSSVIEYLKHDIFIEDYKFFMESAKKAGIDFNKPFVVKRSGEKIWVQGASAPLIVSANSKSVFYKGKEFKLNSDRSLRAQVRDIQKKLSGESQASVWSFLIPKAFAENFTFGEDAIVAMNTVLVLKYRKLILEGKGTEEVLARYQQELENAVFMRRPVYSMSCEGFKDGKSLKKVSISFKDKKSVLEIYQKSNGETCEKTISSGGAAEKCRKDYPLEDRFGAFCNLSKDEQRDFLYQMDEVQSRTITSPKVAK
jgi:hypothetical protein